jgi:hypothetical protein
MPKRWPTWSAIVAEGGMQAQAAPAAALPPRPHRPRSEDASVVLAYLRDLEKWVDSVERSAVLVPATNADSSLPNDLRQAMMAFEDAVQQQDSVAAIATALHLAHLLASSKRAEAAGLLAALARLMPAIQTESFEDLSKAIADLNECEEGTEATRWLTVGWALLDLEAEETP